MRKLNDSYFLAVVFVAVAILLSINAYSWGPTGHRVVGLIAENHLSAAAKIKLRKIMGEERLAQSATWPDEIRSDESRNDQHIIPFWHFVTIPDNRNYEMSKKNPQGDAVFAIEKMIGILKNSKSKSDDRKFAVRWLSHLIGDVHQPLHVGNEKDRGGNLCKVKWGQRLVNLHSIVDDEIIDGLKLSFTELASFLDTRIPTQVTELQKGGPVDWIAESHGLRHEFYRAKDGTLTEDRSFCSADATNEVPTEKVLDFSSDKNRYRFIFLIRPLIERRLREAGIRLAKILNENL